MLKLAFNGMLQVVVVENNRGDWDVSHDADTGMSTLIGYGGENIVTVMPMSMQDGSLDVVLVHAQVDSPSKVAQKCKRLGLDPQAYNGMLNKLAVKAGMQDPMEVNPEFYRKHFPNMVE